MTKPTLDEIESLVRKLCAKDGRNPDEILRWGGKLSGGIPYWVLYTEDAQNILADSAYD